jgi:superfamily I DNA/RNA helicase
VIFYELSWVFTNLASLTDKTFLADFSRPELYSFINMILESEKTTIVDNGLHLSVNLLGSIETVKECLLNTNLIAFIKSKLEMANVKIKIVRKIAWVFSNLGKMKNFLLMNDQNNFFADTLHYALI